MYRTYNIILLGAVALVTLLGAISVHLLQPLSGDLTRLGGYAENNFGWRGHEWVFKPPLATSSVSGTDDGYEDIVVLGDSFSLRTTPDRQTPAGGFWTDFLAADTGLRVGAFFIKTMPPERLLASPAFRTHPPRLVIVELVERSLRRQLLDAPGQCPDPHPHRFDLVLAPLSVVPVAVHRRTAPQWNETGIGQAIDHLAKAIPRWMVGWNDTLVRRLPLSRADLFTSRDPRDLLVYQDDFAKAAWSDRDWAAMRCRLLDWQRRFEANGRTRFLIVVAPDKSSAYAAYLPASVRQPDGVAELAQARALHLPRLDLALRAAIAAGVKDVYLPNDTHWGTAGSKIAADTIVDYLENHAETPPVSAPQSAYTDSEATLEENAAIRP